MIQKILALLVSLTDMQVDHILNLIESAMRATKEAGKTLWVAFGPIAIGYLTWRQAKNRREVKAEIGTNLTAIRENTAITKIAADTTHQVKSHLSMLSDLEQIKSMTALAKKAGSTEPVFYEVDLPGNEYEDFKLSEGARVQWKSESCDVGRKVRFLVDGSAKMGFHFHQVVEILFGVRGVLYMEMDGKVVTLNPGESFEAPPDTVHSARFDGPGEVVAHWPDQQTNLLVIGVYP